MKWALAEQAINSPSFALIGAELHLPDHKYQCIILINKVSSWWTYEQSMHKHEIHGRTCLPWRTGWIVCAGARCDRMPGNFRNYLAGYSSSHWKNLKEELRLFLSLTGALRYLVNTKVITRAVKDIESMRRESKPYSYTFTEVKALLLPTLHVMYRQSVGKTGVWYSSKSTRGIYLDGNNDTSPPNKT